MCTTWQEVAGFNPQQHGWESHSCCIAPSQHAMNPQFITYVPVLTALEMNIFRSTNNVRCDMYAEYITDAAMSASSTAAVSRARFLQQSQNLTRGPSSCANRSTQHTTAQKPSRQDAPCTRNTETTLYQAEVTRLVKPQICTEFSKSAADRRTNHQE
jgi:hypothetical protein